MAKIHTNIGNSKNNLYSSYLKALPWTFFCTGTTRYELTLNSARRLSERFFKACLNQGEEVRMFYSIEPFDVKEGHHIHFLIYIKQFIPDNTLFNTLVDLWQWTTGVKALYVYAGTNKVAWEKNNWNRVNIRSYDSKRGAAGYTSKYITKQHADYDILTSGTELKSLCEVTESDYCPPREKKRRDSVYHINSPWKD